MQFSDPLAFAILVVSLISGLILGKYVLDALQKTALYQTPSFPAISTVSFFLLLFLLFWLIVLVNPFAIPVAIAVSIFGVVVGNYSPS